MSCSEIIMYIVIPIISAIIGGGLTLLGVLITIRNENKNRKEEIRIANKPLFYVIDPLQDYDYKSASDFHFVESKTKKYSIYRTFIFKNTDKGILILNYFEINGIKYYPKYGNVVDKNSIFNANIYANNDIFSKNDNQITLCISDSLDNSYMYNLQYEDDKIIGYSEIE